MAFVCDRLTAGTRLPRRPRCASRPVPFRPRLLDLLDLLFRPRLIDRHDLPFRPLFFNGGDLPPRLRDFCDPRDLRDLRHFRPLTLMKVLNINIPHLACVSPFRLPHPCFSSSNSSGMPKCRKFVQYYCTPARTCVTSLAVPPPRHSSVSVLCCTFVGYVCLDCFLL